jgi:signal transduction histidine kinase
MKTKIACIFFTIFTQSLVFSESLRVTLHRMEYKDDLMKQLNSSHINFASDVKMLPARGKDGGITYNEGTSTLTTANLRGVLKDEDNVEAFENINKTMAILTGKKDFKLIRQLKSFHALGHQIETALITNGWALTFKDVKENHADSFSDWSYTFYFSK